MGVINARPLPEGELHYCALFDGTICEQPVLFCYDLQSQIYQCEDGEGLKTFSVCAIACVHILYPFVN